MSPRQDKRYSVKLEYCGYDTPRHVARFCGEWIGQGKSAAKARELVAEHKAQRANAINNAA